MKKVLIVLASVIALTACGSEPPVNDPAQDEKNYKTCLEDGGSFSKTQDGFSCTFIN